MIIIFNLVGVLMVVMAAVVGWLLRVIFLWIWEGDAGLSLLIAGGLAVVMDLAYRGIEHPEQGRWRFFKPTTGGQLIFLPVWSWGLFFVVYGVQYLGTDYRDLAAEHKRQVVEHKRYLRETVELLDETVQELVKIDTRAGWIAAQDRVESCRQRLRELGPFFEGLDRTEKRQLDKRNGHRITRAVEQLREEAARLNQLPPAQARLEGIKVQ